jgi:hypothetical protein
MEEAKAALTATTRGSELLRADPAELGDELLSRALTR